MARYGDGPVDNVGGLMQTGHIVLSATVLLDPLKKSYPRQIFPLNV